MILAWPLEHGQKRNNRRVFFLHVSSWILFTFSQYFFSPALSGNTHPALSVPGLPSIQLSVSHVCDVSSDETRLLFNKQLRSPEEQFHIGLPEKWKIFCEVCLALCSQYLHFFPTAQWLITDGCHWSNYLYVNMMRIRIEVWSIELAEMKLDYFVCHQNKSSFFLFYLFQEAKKKYDKETEKYCAVLEKHLSLSARKKESHLHEVRCWWLVIFFIFFHKYQFS